MYCHLFYGSQCSKCTYARCVCLWRKVGWCLRIWTFSYSALYWAIRGFFAKGASATRELGSAVDPQIRDSFVIVIHTRNPRTFKWRFYGSHTSVLRSPGRWMLRVQWSLAFSGSCRLISSSHSVTYRLAASVVCAKLSSITRQIPSDRWRNEFTRRALMG